MCFNWSPFLHSSLLQSTVPRMFPKHESDYITLLLQTLFQWLSEPLPFGFRFKCLLKAFVILPLFLCSRLAILPSHSTSFTEFLSVFDHVLLCHASRSPHVLFFLVDTFLFPCINLAELYAFHDHLLHICTHISIHTHILFSMKKFPCSELLQPPLLPLA